MNETIFVTGDRVFFKRAESDEWHGPATIIGMDGVVAILRNGGNVVKTHKNRLRLVGSEEHRVSETIDQPQTEPVATPNCPAGSTNNVSELAKNELSSEPSSLTLESLEPDAASVNFTEQCALHGDKTLADTSGDKPLADTSQIPGRNTDIRFKTKYEYSSGSEFSGKVIGKAGKSTGKNKNWVNIQYNSPEHMKGKTGPVDFEKDVETWSLIDEKQQDTAYVTNEIDEDEFAEAKESELKSWTANHVYERVPDRGQTTIATRWILTRKSDGKLKARLVAKGFQENPDSLITDSPTCGKDTFRLMMTLLASRKSWNSEVLDVKTAFLQGQPLERQVFVVPPPESGETGLWQLKKSVYGLLDASRHWYDRVRQELVALNCTVSPLDSSLFYLKKGSDLLGIICVHVDDFWTAGCPEFYKNVVNPLSDIFAIGTKKTLPYSYLGMDIERTSTGINVRLEGYLEKIDLVGIQSTGDRKKTDPTTEIERNAMRKVLGQLQWLAVQAIPEVAFAVTSFVCKIPKSTFGDLVVLNKLVRTVKFGPKPCLFFPDLGAVDKWRLYSFSDASWANLEDGGTQGGHLVVIGNPEMGNRGAIVTWQSHKLKRIVKSTLAAETMACLDGIDSGFILKKILKELTGSQIPETALVDNKSLIESVKSTKTVQEKRLRVDIGSLKQLTSDQNDPLIMKWIPSHLQLADILTKQRANCGKNLQNLVRNGQFMVNFY